MKALKMPALLAVSIPLAAAALMPLAPGNSWVYRSDRTNQTLTIRVGLTPIQTDGKVYHKLSGYTHQPLWVRVDETGDLYYLDEDTGRDALLTSFQPVDGGWYNAPKRICDQDLRADPKRVAYEGPAGFYTSATKLNYRTTACADAGVEEEFYVENIGMVRRVETTIAGPVAFDLVQANVGPVSVAEKPGTSLRLTLRQQPDTVLANLRLTVEGEPITLTFPSGQEFEMVLRDEAGRELWRWSDGRFFIQIVQQKTVSELSHTAEIPLVLDGRRLPEGLYRVESWLTTTEPHQFKVAADFRVHPNTEARD